MNDSIIVVGAGGHAKVVISTVLAAGMSIAAIYDDAREKWGCKISGFKVSGPLTMIDDSEGQSAIIAVGDNLSRNKIALRFKKLKWVNVVHPSAFVHPSVRLGNGTVVFAGAVIQPDALMGEHCIVNTGATVDHDCEIGSFAHISPGVNLAGSVNVGEGVFIGIGSAVIIGVRIGEWTTIGAGSAVIGDLPSNSVSVGVPARVIKSVKRI